MDITLGPAALTQDVLGVEVTERATPDPWDAASAEPPYWWADADRLLFHGDRTRMYVTADEVLVDAPDAGARAEEDWLLYATAARALLTFRRRYNLHATIVVPPHGRAVAILGESTAGKSTTTAELVRRGWGFACDDIAEVAIAGEAPTVHPIERPVHLADDVAVRLGAELSDGRPLPMRDKRAYAVSGADLTPRPLGAMVVLSALATSDDVEAFPVAPLEGLTTVAASADRYGICQLPEHRAGFLRWSTALCRQVPLWAVRRPRAGDSLEEVVDAVARIAGSAGSA